MNAECRTKTAASSVLFRELYQPAACHASWSRLQKDNECDIIVVSRRDTRTNLTVNPEMERFIEEQVKAGNFSSPSEVLEAGLARLMLDPELEEPGDLEFERIQSALDQADRGELIDAEAVHAEMRRRYVDRG
jgi:putative addiction module CopG family antidote